MEIEPEMTVIDDHKGEEYTYVLDRLHRALKPKTYLEIGVFTGQTLQFSKCPTIAIDPDFRLAQGPFLKEVLQKRELFLFQMGSDEFFSSRSPRLLFDGAPVDMAFLDGMHRCEYLLRDFINTEKHCKRNSIIGMHDCLPVERPMTSRVMGAEAAINPRRAGWWTGDVWRTALLLRRRRPDIELVSLDAAPTGLVLATNLDPNSTVLEDSYQSCVKDMMSWDLDRIGIQQFFDEMHLQATSVLSNDEAVTSHFWL